MAEMSLFFCTFATIFTGEIEVAYKKRIKTTS